jgi:hypothetical protein
MSDEILDFLRERFAQIEARFDQLDSRIEKLSADLSLGTRVATLEWLVHELREKAKPKSPEKQ